MSGPHPDEGLIDLVSSIDDDRPVDWVTAEHEARSDEDRATIRELKIISDIARVYRDPDSVLDDPPAHDPAPDTPKPFRTWGPLEVFGEIDRGAFSTIHRAVDRLEREVALKVLSLGAGEADRTRILREGRLLARLRHRNIVSVYGIDEVDGEVGLWMELIRGNTLEQDLRARGPMNAHEATGIAVDLCHALAAIHGAGLLHRDVKAQNVMRESGGRTVLMDFGAGIDLLRDPAARLRVMAGTPLYLAPEVFKHAPPSVASDIYSLGVLLFRMVTGKFPVEGATFDDLVKAHERGERSRLRDVRADLPEAFVRVVERALDPKPDARYRSAGEFEAALLRPDREIAPEPTPTNWWVVAAAAAVALVALGAVVVPIISRQGSTERPGSVVASGSTSPAPETAPVPPAMQPYTVEAAFHKWTGRGDRRLANNERVAPGDGLLLTLHASRPIYAYVYNEDAEGRRFALYPLDEADFARPLPAERIHRLPGLSDGDEQLWTVSTSGTRERFVVAVGLERDAALEAWLRTLPKPSSNAPIEGPSSEIGRMRGAGGLSTRPPTKDALVPSPLGDPPALGTKPETVTGPWARQLTLVNP